MRRFERNFSRGDSLHAAVKIRETFMDRPVERQDEMRWKWPKRMHEAGEWRPGEGAICYASDKWQKRRDHMIDYKHVAEGTQRLLVVPGFLREYRSPGKKLRIGGPMVDVDGPMPDAFAKLAPILGIQAHLYEGDEDHYELNGDDGFYQINIAKAELGAAKHPRTGQTFLFIYTEREGVVCIITGDILDVEKDGIVG